MSSTREPSNGAIALFFNAGELGAPWLPPVAHAHRWPAIRAERAKLKSRRDDLVIAQGKRGTSAALGKRPPRWGSGGANQALEATRGLAFLVFPCSATQRALSRNVDPEHLPCTFSK